MTPRQVTEQGSAERASDEPVVEGDLVPGMRVRPRRDRGRRRRRRTKRLLIVLGLTVLALIGVVAAGIFAISEHLGNNVARVPNVFGTLDASARPPAGPELTFLVVGTDSRSKEPTTGSDAPAGVDAGSQRSDVIMLVQLAPDRTGATVVSIPRDSWVDVPGRGRNKINAAYAFGGAPLLIRTVEQLTAVHIDHFGVIDFAGFQSVVDAVGGIDVQVKDATHNLGVEFRPGANHLDGAAALAYVRQRYDLPGGDIDRAKRQQNALRALLSKAVTGGTVGNPVQLYRFLDAITRSVSVDDTLTNGGFRSLVLESRGLRPSGVTFLTSPVRGLGREGSQSVVYLDDSAAAQLWQSLRDGTTSQYATTHPGDRLGAAPA